MRCLYCGKQLALFRRLTGGGEFCSDSHKASYHDEFNRLALARLKQAQEKSDELRAAAPQNQLALIRKVPGEIEPPSIRSNAHWMEPKPWTDQKPSRPPQRKPLAIAAPAAPSPPAEPVAPKSAIPNEGGFIEEMPKPAAPAVSMPEVPHLESCSTPPTHMMPTWEPPVAPMEEPAPDLAGFVPLPEPEPAESSLAQAGPIAPDPIHAAIDGVHPKWPLATTSETQLPPGQTTQGYVPPQPREPIFANDATVPPTAGPTPHPSIPAVTAAASVIPLYPSLPAVEIDPLRFAPSFEVQVELRSQGLPFRFDFTPFTAPDFDILESGQTSPPQLKGRKRQTQKRTEPAQVLDPPPADTIRRKAATSPQALGIGTIGEIAALVTPVKSLQQNQAVPAEGKLAAGSFLPHPPATVLPLSSALSFPSEEPGKPTPVSNDSDDKRPSTLKVKLAAMAPLPPPTTTTEAPKLEMRPPVQIGLPPERKPAERSAVQPQSLFGVPPRRKTVPVPSILDPRTEGAGEEQKSLWAALRKYLGK
jgi:hypothetical protein